MGSILSMQWPVSGSHHAIRRRTPDALLILSGTWLLWRGRAAVLWGLATHNDIVRARGYRLQLVGVLQRVWRRDRPGVEAWVDALLRRRAAGARTSSGNAGNGARATPLLLQET